jgi:ABC-type transporter Mla MlaB component
VECWIGVGQEGDRRIVRLAGRFAEAQVPELMQVCAAGGPVCLDLTELVSTDAAGLEALCRVREQGAMLTGAPTYIQLRLDSIARKSRPSRI